MITGSWIDQIMRHPLSFATGKIELVPGQIVNGKVLQLLPERQALLQIGGMQVLAQLESKLEVGERVWLQVQDKGQPFQLKTVVRPEVGIGPNRPVEGKLTDLAKVLDFDSTPEHRELLSRLIDSKIPLSKDTIPVFKSALKDLGGDEQAIETILLAAKRGLPLTKEVLKGLKTFFYGNGFSELTHQLKQEIVQTLQLAPVSLVPETKQKLEILLQQFKGLHTVDLHSADSIREGLSNIFHKMGLLQPDHAEEVRNGISQDRTIPSLLEELKSVLSENPGWEKTAEKMEKMLQFANGQHVMASPSETWFQQLLLHIPFSKFGNHSFLQMEAKKRKNGEIDPDHCRLLFCLELARLGDMMVDVKIVNRIVSLDILGPQVEKLQFIPGLKSQLETGLKGLGYQLSSVKICENSSMKENQDPFQRGMATPYKGVDLRI